MSEGTLERWTEERMFGLLQDRYPPPAHALLRQVANGTGAAHRRNADAILMGLYPSAGLELEGFEIKVSRSDFQAELKDLSKHAEVARYCDRWWIVVPDKAIASPEELPTPWGLMYAYGSKLPNTDLVQWKLRVAKQAAKLEPEPMRRVFLAAILRRAMDVVPKAASPATQGWLSPAEVEERVSRAVRNAVRDRGGNAFAEQQYEALCKSVREFEAASGVHIHAYSGAQLGERWRLAQGLPLRIADIQRAADNVRCAADALTKAADELRLVEETAKAAALAEQLVDPRELTQREKAYAETIDLSGLDGLPCFGTEPT